MSDIVLFDWDDEIQNDGEDREFITLEAGDYEFEVNKYERGRYTPSGNGKTPPCNQIEVTLAITTKDGIAYVKDRFPLASTFEWKISGFFRSVGLKKHGEKLRMCWDEAIGCKGKAKITKTEGNKEGLYFNNVDKYIDPIAKGAADEWS